MQTKLTIPAKSGEKLPEPEPIKLKMPEKSPTQPFRVSVPKYQTEIAAKGFSGEMVRIGARFNSTYNDWMIPAGREQEAVEIRNRFPDGVFEKPINGATLQWSHSKS